MGIVLTRIVTENLRRRIAGGRGRRLSKLRRVAAGAAEIWRKS
jgi:hypothetical protein